MQGSHRSVESHLQGPVGASGSFAPEASLGAGALATVTIAALYRQIDHLLDQRRIKRHAIPSDTTAGPTKPMGDRDAQAADHVAEAPR